MENGETKIGKIPVEFFEFADDVREINKQRGYKGRIPNTKIMRRLIASYTRNRWLMQDDMSFIQR